MNSAKKAGNKISESRPPSFRLRNELVRPGTLLLAAGKNWPSEAIQFRIGETIISPWRLLRGNYWNQFIVPDAFGNFLVEFSTTGLKPGKYVMEAFTNDETLLLKERLIVEEQVWPGKNVPRSKVSKAIIRFNAFNQRRWAVNELPPLYTNLARKGWETIHGKIPGNDDPIDFFSAPVPGQCNWTPMGPAPFSMGKTAISGNNSGRIRSIAIHPTIPSVMYIGAATGGVWKSENSGLSWQPVTDDKFSLAIGALAIDPITPSTVYAGTGEYAPGVQTTYYGNGLLKSTDSGNTWNEIGMVEFAMADISRIQINPGDPNNLYVSGSNGIWESVNGGSNWTQLTADPSTDIVLIQKPGEPGKKQLLAGLTHLGIRVAFYDGTWSTFDEVFAPTPAPNTPQVNATAAATRTVFGVCKNKPNIIYAAITENMIGNALAYITHSDDYGVNWTACSLPSDGVLAQSMYNLVIQPHPDIPQTVIFGNVDTFKSTDGGASWKSVTVANQGGAIHRDCHAIVFHPSNPNSLFIGCDGGLFHSPSLCEEWKAINLNLSTLQLFDFGQHPQYDAILIAGAQDNGGFHYSGAPIWNRHWANGTPQPKTDVMQGDVVSTAIDPFNANIHYYGTQPDSSFLRSENAGLTFPTFWQMPAGATFWAPFFTDPRTEGVLYAGGDDLIRSDNRGDNWSVLLKTLPGGLRAIGFHPVDPLVLYIGTLGGKVFRIQGPVAGEWNATTIISTNVTFAGLPDAQQISSLAVDPDGNVWASLSNLILAKDSGEFSNHHVFRLDAGATTWVEKSAGLAIGNPVNTIIIDPVDATKVYCGADRGVFSWNADAQAWMLFDQGLPNAPVTVLKIHEPSRKLRAATYGRGMWERYLESANCSDHFLYMRKHIADSGSEPAAEGVIHPYYPGHLCWHWQSPDIIVDGHNQSPEKNIQTALDVCDNVLHSGGSRGFTNYIYILVHNKGPFAVENVRVCAFFTGASAGLPDFPKDFLPDPFLWTPTKEDAWNPLGKEFFIGRIEPGTTGLAFWTYKIPESAPQHSCVIAFVTSTDDPFTTGGITNPDELVLKNRRVALKNLDFEGPAFPDSAATVFAADGLPGSSMKAQAMISASGFTSFRQVRMNSSAREGAWYHPAFHCANLPEDAVILVANNSGAENKTQEYRRPSEHAEKALAAFKKIGNHPHETRGFDLDNIQAYDIHAQEIVRLPDMFIHKDKPVDIAIWIWSSKWDPETNYAYDVLQRQGERVIGGFTVSTAKI